MLHGIQGHSQQLFYLAFRLADDPTLDSEKMC